MEKFDVLKMKMVIDSKKKPHWWAYIFPWWIGGNLPLMTNTIRFWNERDVNHILNERDKKVWSLWDENDNRKKNINKIGFFTKRGKLTPIYQVGNIEKIGLGCVLYFMDGLNQIGFFKRIFNVLVYLS